ncbi:general substrate transporter [Pseudohyphozyma bogoriensis]|nr:general substrate transporter [Pseudohyphozyma bogoriensis]
MPNFKVLVFCGFIAFGGFLFGYDIGVISGCLIMPDFKMRFGYEDPANPGEYILSATRQSEITSLLSAGTFFGALAQTFTADSLGRKGSILLWSIIFTIGVTIQTATERSLAQLLVGRLIAGFGVGALSALVPLFNGEAAPKHLRGMLLTFYQVQIISGLFLSYVLDLATHSIGNSASWRIPVGIQILWGLGLCIGILFLPESPRHLIYKGRIDDARKAIAQLNSTAPDSALADDIIAEITEGLREENEGGKATWAECFSPKIRLRTINGMMIQFLQQLNGQNFYYGDTFFSSSGTVLSAYVIQVILGGVSFACIFPALYLVEVLGRRKSLLWGAIIEAICALIAGLVGHFTLAPTGTATADLTSREEAGGKVMIAFWNFMLGYFAPRIASDIGPLILLIFAGMLIVAFVYVGLSLEQVDEMHRDPDVKPWTSATWQPKHGTTRKRAFERTYYASELADGKGDAAAREDAERIRVAKGLSPGTVHSVMEEPEKAEKQV